MLNKNISTIATVALPINESWQIQRCRYQSDELDTRLCITSGIHGDELLGQLILFEIGHTIQQHPELFHGTLDLYPMLNPLGLDNDERMVPMHTRLDMNRAFPGEKSGTPLESICWQIIEEIKDADLVLDLHSGANEKNELFEVRMSHCMSEKLLSVAPGLRPDIIWVYPDIPAFDSSLTGALSKMGVPAMILEADRQEAHPERMCRRVVDGIFSKMHDLGMWDGEIAASVSPETIPVIYSREDIARITCQAPGIYVPQFLLGSRVQKGAYLGKVINALEGTVAQEIYAPCAGYLFTQRSCSAAYPGTLLARIRKEEYK